MGGHLHWITEISDNLLSKTFAGWLSSKPGGRLSSCPAPVVYNGHDDFACRWSWPPDPINDGDSSDKNSFTCQTEAENLTIRWYINFT